MLKFYNVVRPAALIISRFCFCTAAEKWDILSSVSLERCPVISRDLNDLEKKFQKLLLDIEYERSHKSQFELRVESDKKRTQDVKEGKVSINDMESFPQQTGQDFLDASLEELKSFKFSSRKNSDLENDTKSTERSLDRYLLLLVNEIIGQKPQWLLPQGKRIAGENLRETAERVLKEKCGSNINVKFMGNAPVGFYKYRYPLSVRTADTVGAKIFFFKAHYLGGQIDLSEKKCTNFMWATRNELQILRPDYLKSVEMFLISEEH